MGKIKLNLNDLKVQSFVTSLDDEEKQNVKGGLPLTCNTCNEIEDCSVTYVWVCESVQMCYTDPEWGNTCQSCEPSCIP